MLVSYDAYPDSLIPRMTWEYDPNTPGTCTYTLPASDVERARPLDSPPEFVARPHHETIEAVLRASEAKNGGGEITVSERGGQFIVAVTFFERMNARNASRRPVMEQQWEILNHLATLSQAQYQFGVPRAAYDLTLPLPPSRLALHIDRYSGITPRFVASAAFRETHAAILREDRGKAVLQAAADFVRAIDPEAPNHMEHGLSMGKDLIMHIPGDCACYGRRGDEVPEPGHEDAYTSQRLQTGDAWIGSSHNWGGYNEAKLVMAIAGGINRIARVRRPTRLPAQL